jgi:hypothetical protein
VNGRAPGRAQRAVLIRDGDYIQLTDLDTAGYLFGRELVLQDAWKVSRYKYKFVFYDPQHQAENMAMEFINSSDARTCDAIGRLKKVIHRFYGRDDDGHPRKNGHQGDRAVHSKERDDTEAP